MKKFKKWVALVISLAMMIATIMPAASMKSLAAQTPFTVLDLKVDNVKNPIGIDNKTPHFSWKMESAQTGQKQSAYQIVVEEWDVQTSSKGEVWNSGKVSGDASIDIPYGGNALESSVTYHWSVTVWDQNDQSAVSEEASFEMGLVEENPFADVNWIRMPKKGDPDPDAPEPEVDKSVYTIEMNGKFKDALGIIFGATDNSHYYMWQINNNMEKGVEGTWIRPHRWDGNPKMFNPENLPDYDGYKLDTQLNSEQQYQLKLEVNTTTQMVTTYIDGTKIHELNCGNADLSYGKIGIRAATNPTSGFQEQVWMDDLKVTANDGTILFYQDFELAADTQFDGGQVQNGALYVTHGTGSGDTVFLTKDSSSYYRFDTDFTIKSGKAGIIYGAAPEGEPFYYSQINPNFEGRAAVVQHVQEKGGRRYKFDSGDITNVTAADLVGQKHHFTLTCSKNQEVRIYIDGVEAKYHDKLGDFVINGKIGFNSDAGDEVSYDNTVVKIAGIPQLFADHNTADNAFTAGTVNDNALTVNGNTTALSKAVIGSNGVAEPDPVIPAHYTVEADINITSDSAGIIFSAKDGANMFMWQINGSDHKDKDEKPLLYLRPHIWADGTAHYAAYEKDISSFFDYETEILGQEIPVKIEVTNSEIKTYIKDTLVDTFVITAETPGKVIDARVGFRSGTEKEIFTADNLKVTSYDEEGTATQKFLYDFEDGINPFSGSAGQANAGAIKDGKYLVKGNAGAIMTKDYSNMGTPMFRKVFDAQADKKIVSAKVYASSLGIYDLYVNGSRVGNKAENGEMQYDELKPGWTDYNKRVLYYSHDITDLLKSADTNVMLATVSTGWWTGRVGYGAYGNKDMAFIAKTIITYSDGTQDILNTDSSWKTSKESTIREGDIWDGETYDANYASAKAISTAEFVEDESWNKVSYSTDFNGIISAQLGQSVQVRKELERTPVSTCVYQGKTDNGSEFGAVNVIKDDYAPGDKITLSKGQTVVYDLGQNMVGWPNISITAPKDTEVTTHFAEMLNDSGEEERGNDGPMGSLYTANYRSALSTGRYIANGTGVENYRPTFSFYGFRYVSVTATEDITIESFKAEVVGSAIPEIGKLETSNSSVNQLISNVLWGQRGNYLSVPTDCPQRDERLGWSGDTQIFVGAATYNADVSGFFNKWGQDTRDTQKSGGEYGDTIPNVAVGAGNAAWGDAGIIVPYTLYKMYGDTRIITDMYDSMKKYMDWMESRGYIGAGLAYGDWLAYESNDDNVRRLIACAYYGMDALYMAEMCDAIGKADEAVEYRIRYGGIKNYFQTQFMNSDGTLKAENATQTCYLLALKTDMFADEIQKKAAADKLVNKIKENGNKLGTGFVGTGTLNQTLSDIGENNMAYTLLLQRDNPSWLYSVDQGATTIWERWNSYTKENGFGDVGMNSFNHYSYGAVVEWMYSDMLGIEADIKNPGFKNIILQPQPDTRTAAEIPANQERITAVKGSYDSAYGKILAEWNWSESEFSYKATVPANTTATAYIPAAADKAVTVNGKATNQLTLELDGIKYIETKDDKAVFETVAGTFDFKVREKGPKPQETKPADPVLVSKTKNSVTLKAVTGYEYAKQTGTEKLVYVKSAKFDGLKPKTAYKFYQRIAATDEFLASVDSKALSVTTDAETVVQADKVTLKETTLTLKKGSTKTLSATVLPANAADKKVTWSSNNTGVVSVNSTTGLVTAVKSGKATITAKTANNKTASCVITVTEDKPTVVTTGVKLNVTKKTLKVKQSYSLSAVAVPGNAVNKSFKWKSSNTKVVTVSSTGKLSAKKAGTAVITVTTTNNKKATCKVTVVSAPTSIKLNVKSKTMGIKQSDTLKPTLVPSYTTNKKLKWKSSNSKVASVGSTGKVTAKKAGTATITVTTENGKKTTCKITVKKAPTSIRLNAKAKTIKKGSSYKLKATLSSGSSGTVTYSSSNKSIATVSSDGKIKALKKGKVTITAKTYNGKKAVIKVTVK